MEDNTMETQPEPSMSAKSTDPEKKKVKKKKQKRIRKTGVIYIKHIPHGFYEDEMKGFFSQFGRVLRVTVARSSKTGNSKGYGYVQFIDNEVAKIAAETMNNYLMFEKIVKCSVLAPEMVTSATFANSRRRPGLRCPGETATQQSLERLNSASGGRVQLQRSKRRRRLAQRRTIARLAELGVHYDLVGGTVKAAKTIPSSPLPQSPPTPETPAVLSVDPDDTEVTFRTPPNTVRRVMSKKERPLTSKAVAASVRTVKTVVSTRAGHAEGSSKLAKKVSLAGSAKVAKKASLGVSAKVAKKASPVGSSKLAKKASLAGSVKGAKKASLKADRRSGRD